MQPDDIVRILHMLDSSREAVSFISGKARDDLNEDRKLALSLVKSIEIIGEAASKVSEEARAACPRYSLAGYYGYAKSTYPCLFRYQSGHRMGHGGPRITSTHF